MEQFYNCRLFLGNKMLQFEEGNFLRGIEHKTVTRLERTIYKGNKMV